MVIPTKQPLRPAENAWARLVVILMGIWIALSMVKSGNPVILDHLATQALDWTKILNVKTSLDAVQPASGASAPGLEDVIAQPWSFKCGFWALIPILLVSLKAAHWRCAAPIWLCALPGAWLIWQCLAAIPTVQGPLSLVTLQHFGVCVAGFYLGLFVLSHAKNLNPFLLGLMLALVVVLWFGFGQHYGGLESLRRGVYERPDWRGLPDVFLKRITSDRIFGTLVYPNALAGMVLSILPLSLVTAWRISRNLPRLARGVTVGLLGYAGLACLFWTGSKAAWLIGLVLGMLLLLRVRLSRSTTLFLVVLVLVFGTGGFLVKFSKYFQKGATSVVARFDYWQAAWQTARANPWLGTGPGTFSIPYQRIKKPESEMARLCHNDYLEQATDSGFVGFFLYFTFVFGVLVYLYRQLDENCDWLHYAIWLGLAGWALQEFVEFGLYIPAIAWPCFILMGYLMGAVGRQNNFDRPRVVS
jgi:hypothetical protein